MNLGPVGPKGVVVIVKIAAWLFALTLSLAACASDGDESNTATDEVGSEVADQDEATDEAADATDEAEAEEEASTDDAAGDETEAADGGDNAAGTADDSTTDDSADDATADDSTADDSTADDSAATGDAGLLLTALLAQAGLEPTDEIIGCVEDRGVDIDITTTADEQAVQEATLVLFTCAPDELAEILAAETPPPAGTTADDVECVIAETFRYLGSLPTDEAIAALEQSEMPDEIRAEVLPIIEDNCGLDEEQASAIFDS